MVLLWLTFLMAHLIPKIRIPTNSVTARGQRNWKGAKTTKMVSQRRTKVQKTFQASRSSEALLSAARLAWAAFLAGVGRALELVEFDQELAQAWEVSLQGPEGG